MLSLQPLKKHPFLSTLTSLLLFIAQTNALFVTGSSPRIQDLLTNPPPTICPLAQDGATSDTFPWSINPICADLVPQSSHSDHFAINRQFCVYTNTAFNSGRGVSLVTTPEVAAELTKNAFQENGAEGLGDVAWTQKEVEGKGQGLFARRNVEAGETLILESPVLFVNRELLSSPSRQKRRVLLETAVGQLPERTREMVMRLSRRGGEDVLEDLINVNAVRVKVWEGTSHLIIVPDASRINHACRPNAFYRFDDNTLNFDVFALKDIKAGDELTFSYGFSQLPHPNRSAALESTWGFTCTCPLCTSTLPTINASNARLTQISELKAILPTSPDDIPKFIPLLPELISLLEKEELFTEIPIYEEILAYTWSAFGIKERAVYWAGRAKKHWRVLAGRTSWEFRRMEELEGNVEGHGSWMSWEGDPWDEVGKGHPWFREGYEHEHKHDHDHDH